ncbi:MAG: glycosyltransferase family 4 protein [Thermoplasmata archaeon]
MRVLHLIDIWDASYERDQIKLIEYLGKKKEYEFTIITSMHDDNFRRRKRDFFKNMDADFPYVKIYRKFSIDFKLYGFHNAILYAPSLKIFDEYDIVHAYGLGSYSSFLASFLKKTNSKIKFVMRSDLSWQTYERMVASRNYKNLLLYPLKLADGVYAYTEKEKNYLVNLGLGLDKIRKIPVGITYSRYEQARKRKLDRMIELNALSDNQRKKITFGYLGRLHYDKGPDRLIGPFAKLKSEYPGLEILFSGPESDAKYAKEVLGKLRNIGAKYLGFIPNEKKVEFLGDVDVIFVPSRVETGAIVALESMASGCAVIAIDESPMNEYIIDGENGLLAKNEDEIYNKAKHLLDSPNEIFRFGKNAQESAKKYDWEKIAEYIAKFYDDIGGKSVER